jgi:DNA mismatch repair protein MutS
MKLYSVSENNILLKNKYKSYFSLFISLNSKKQKSKVPMFFETTSSNHYSTVNKDDEQVVDCDKGVLDEYFRLTKLYQGKYGPKTLLLYQIGKFFEVYGYKHPDHDTIQGSLIEEFSYVCDLRMSSKAIKYEKKYPVYLSGFHTSPMHIEKYKDILLEQQFTLVFYVEEEGSGSAKKKKTRIMEGVYSPGTYIPPETTVQNNTYTVSIWVKSFIYKKQNHYCTGMALYNVVTNQSYLLEYTIQDERIHSTTFDDMERVLSIYRPKEVILVTDVPKVRDFVPTLRSMYVHEYNSTMTIVQNAEKQRHCDHVFGQYFDVDMVNKCMEFQEYPLATQSFVILLHFLEEHNPILCKKMSLPIWESKAQFMKLANNTLLQLNIIDNQGSNKSSNIGAKSSHNISSLNSVYSLLDHCKTSMGSRMFYYQLTHPVYDCTQLNQIYDLMDIWVKNQDNLDSMSIYRKQLQSVHDIDHLSRLLVNRKITPLQISYLYGSLQSAEQLWTCLAEMPLIHQYASTESYSNTLNQLQSVLHYLDERFQWSSIHETCFLKPSFFPELELLYKELLQCNSEWDSYWMFMETLMNPKNPIKETHVRREFTSDKRGGGTACAYFQITQTKSKKMEEKLKDFQKKPREFFSQNDDLERWIQSNKKELMEDFKKIHFVPSTKKNYMMISSPILSKLSSTLQEIEQSIQTTIQTLYKTILDTLEDRFYNTCILASKLIARLDVLWNKCTVALENHYCRPTIGQCEETSNGETKSYVKASGLRHVLIEKLLRNETYVPNDVEFGLGNPDGMLLFGTNAVGKTSLMRALGIAVIMAQSGMFVPCSEFVYYPYRSIFSRIINQDNLFKGLSTFDVEMSELRIIWKYGDCNSLILGDELCSGTESTSALCIVMTTLQHLYNQKSSYLLATHFHEITRFPELTQLDTLHMCHLSVVYNGATDSLEYERLLQDGPGNANYGLEVCRSLQMPEELMEMAYQFRSQYFPEYTGSLKHKSSRYNVEKIRGKCEMCGLMMSEETHHLQEQQYANSYGYIGTIHKNHKANLMTLCSSCHDAVHDDSSTIEDSYSNYSKPSVMKNISPLTEDSHGNRIRRIKTTKGYRVNIHR